MKLDKSQLEFCNSNSNEIRLLAPAGSGKTLSLLWRCKYLSEKSKDNTQKFLIFTFTKVAKDELKDRLNSDNDFTDIKTNIRIETLNQWGFNYLKGIEKGITVKASKKDRYFLVRNVLRPIWIKTDYKDIIEKITNKYDQLLDIFDALKSIGFRHDIDDIHNHFESHILWISNNGLEKYFTATIIEPLIKLGLIKNHSKNCIDNLKDFIIFWKNCCQHLWDSAVISLEDQKYWAYLKLDEKYIDNKTFQKPNRYNHIMIDEFQDINPLDLMLIKTLKRVNDSTLTIIGDDDQAIYEWRGSTPSIILKPEKHFNKEFEKFTLQINYRSPKNIVEISQNLIGNNRNRVSKNIKPFSNDNAEINHIIFSTHVDCLSFLLKYAVEANNSRKPKNLAIISRKKSQIIPIQIVLTSENIPFFAKEDLNILLSSAFKDLKKILEIVEFKNNKHSSEELVKNFIHLINKVKLYPLNFTNSKPLYAYLLKQKPKLLTDALSYLLNYKGTLRGNAQEYYNAISNVINTSTVSETIETIGNEFAGLQKHYSKSDDDIFFKDPPFTYLAEFARKYGDDYTGFIEHVENAIEQMESITMIDDKDVTSKDIKFSDTDISDDIDKDLYSSIHLMTALRAKGKEFDTVILLDVNEGVWPSKYAQTLQELEQERRIFYVAITRAKQKLIILSVNSILNKELEISRYINELGIDFS